MKHGVEVAEVMPQRRVLVSGLRELSSNFHAVRPSVLTLERLELW